MGANMFPTNHKKPQLPKQQVQDDGVWCKFRRSYRMDEKRQLKKIQAPITFITRGREAGKRPAIIIGTCWSIGGPFCIETGGKYAVFEPQNGTIGFTHLKKHENPLPDATFLYRLSRIEDQATYPVLYPLDALTRPSEAEKALFEMFVSHLRTIFDWLAPVQEARPAAPDTDQGGVYPHQLR